MFLPAHIAVIGNGGFAGFTAFGGNHDDTVGSPGSIDGGGRSVFQYVHRHDVAGVDAGQGVVGRQRVVGVNAGSVYNHSVNDENRLVGGVERVDTTDMDRGVCTRLARVGLYLYTCGPAL